MARKKLSGKLILACCVLLCGCQSIRSLHSTQQLHDGDLLFHVEESGNAITAVTQGIDALAIDHVAIYYTAPDGAPRAVQAIYDGVVTTTLDSLLSEPGYYVAGRVHGADIGKSVHRALNEVGKPYDFVFSPDTTAIYCSELVTMSYIDKKGQRIFAPIPMTFRDASGDIPVYWQSFYSQRNLSIPEGVAGSNPGELSRRNAVKIKYQLHDFAKRGYQQDHAY